MRIGLIGGMSWQSTVEYYRLLNELTRERLGGLHSAECLLHSVEFAELEAMQRQGRWAEAAKLLADAARGLEAAGADLLLICANTMHKVADEVQDAVSVPLLHIGDATSAAVRRAGLDSVGLLGTRYTMEQDFLRNRLEAAGLTVLVPADEPDRAELHRMIYEELSLGRIEPASKRACLDMVDRLGRRRRGRGGARLHRARAAGEAGGRRRTAVPHHPPARRGGAGGGRHRVSQAVAGRCHQTTSYPSRASRLASTHCARSKPG